MSKEQTIVFGTPLFDVKTGKDIDWYVTNFCLAAGDRLVVSLERPGAAKVQHIVLSMETAEGIGLINWNALNKYFQ